MTTIDMGPGGPVQAHGVALELEELADKINAAARVAEQQARSAVYEALRVGKLLLQAKALVPHGEWGKWLAEHCTVAPRTAQAYMRLADKFSYLTDETATAVARLPLREAMRAIATPPASRPRMPAYKPQPPHAALAAFAEGWRASKVMGECGAVLRTASRDLKRGRRLNRDRIERLRSTALAVAEELDRMLVAITPAEDARAPMEVPAHG